MTSPDRSEAADTVREAELSLPNPPDPSGTAAAPIAPTGPAALRGSLLRGGAYALTTSMSLCSAPLLIRHLGLPEYGRYATVVALVTVVGGLTDAGMVIISVREWSTRTGEERTQVMRQLLGLRLELSALGVAAGVGFALLAGYSRVLVLGTVVAGVGMFLQVVADLLTAPLQSEMRFGWASLVDLSRQTVFVTCIVVLVLAGAGVLPFLAATIPSSFVALLFAASLARRHTTLRPVWSGRHRWTLLRDTLPFSAATAVNTFYFRVTILAMSLIASATQTGYFATSFRVTEVLIAVPALAIGTAFPIISRAAVDDRERFSAAVERLLELSLIVGAALVLVVILMAPLAIRILAGKSGAPATSVLQIQAICLLATFPAVASGYVLLSVRRHRVLLFANVGALCMNILLTLILVPIDQAHGAAIAALVSEFTLAAGQTITCLRSGDARLSPVSVLTIGLCAACGAAVLLVPIGSLGRTAAGLAIYIGMLVGTKKFPPEVGHVLPKGEWRRLRFGRP